MLKVTWPQLRRLLNIDETFAATGGDFESYTVMDRYMIRVRHEAFDNEVYTVDQYVQLIKDEEDDSVVCVIQLEGQSEEPLSFDIAEGTVEIEMFSKCTPPMMFAP